MRIRIQAAIECDFNADPVPNLKHWLKGEQVNSTYFCDKRITYLIRVIRYRYRYRT
jgi:hypothetical protein